jgi:hypothetical protein
MSDPYWDEMRWYLAEIPDHRKRKQHSDVWLGFVVAFVLTLGPWGSSLIDSHPCITWFCWTLALVFGGYSFWSIAPIYRWARILILIVVTSTFLFYTRQSLNSETELSFFFVDLGIFLVEGTGEWLLLVTGENAHKPLLNVQMVLEDVVTSRAVSKEPDMAKRAAMIRGGTIQKDYAEINSTFLGDQIRWRPIDVNNQEYSIQARYRIGDKAYLSNEELRIANVGTRFVSVPQTAVPVWTLSMTVRNQSGTILMHCIDPQFPHDSRWIAGPACFPGPHYGPLPRSLCSRCFSRGFEFYLNDPSSRSAPLSPPVEPPPPEVQKPATVALRVTGHRMYEQTVVLELPIPDRRLDRHRYIASPRMGQLETASTGSKSNTEKSASKNLGAREISALDVTLPARPAEHPPHPFVF